MHFAPLEWTAVTIPATVPLFSIEDVWKEQEEHHSGFYVLS